MLYIIQWSLKTEIIKTKNLLTIILFHFLVCSQYSEDEEQENEERHYAHNIYIRFTDYTMNY